MGFSLLQKIGASLLIVAWVLWGGNMIADFLVPVPEPQTASNDAAPVAATAQAGKPAEPEVPVTTPAGLGQRRGGPGGVQEMPRLPHQ